MKDKICEVSTKTFLQTACYYLENLNFTKLSWDLLIYILFDILNNWIKKEKGNNLLIVINDFLNKTDIAK